MRINNNVMAFNAYRNLTGVNDAMGKSLEKLSSGLRINRAADDAAGLVISNGLRAQVSGLRVSVRNAQDGISVVQTAEGALTEVNTMLQRMRDLAVQSANGSNSQSARSAAQAEFQQLWSEISRIGSNTAFGTLSLLNGSFSAGVTFQVGANSVDVIAVQIATLNAGSVGSLSGLSAAGIATFASASAAIASIDAAIDEVSRTRGNLGALQNRFESTINSVQNAIENLAASESRIRDTDMAMEMTNLTRNQILQQAGQSMLSQAQQLPQGVLKLLGG